MKKQDSGDTSYVEKPAIKNKDKTQQTEEMNNHQSIAWQQSTVQQICDDVAKYKRKNYAILFPIVSGQPVGLLSQSL